MILRKLGELGLIKEISGWLGSDRRAVKGIGDDTAVLKYDRNRYLLFTTDMLIGGVHFKPSRAKAALIGRKALAVNISDIAAMGGVPKYGVVAIGLPPSMKIDFVRRVYMGMKKLADKFDTDIIGGDTNRSDKFVINLSLVGEVKKKNLVLRSGAKPGDTIFVTGRLGGSLKSGRHLSFEPRLKEANFLTKNFKINSMIDISDGLASDLARITESSNVGAVLYEESIPASKGCNVKNALFDGEDFELLFTALKKDADKILKKWPFKLKLSEVGRITAAKKTVKLKSGKKEKNIAGKGFRHF